jgi:hypothetical protein
MSPETKQKLKKYIATPKPHVDTTIVEYDGSATSGLRFQNDLRKIDGINRDQLEANN